MVLPTITHSPATQALELQQQSMMAVLTEAQRQGSSCSIVSYEFFKNLSFEEDNNNNITFPVIEWDHSSNEDYSEDSSFSYDSSSSDVRSMDDYWNSVSFDYSDSSSSSSSSSSSTQLLGKRRRCCCMPNNNNSNNNTLSSSPSRRRRLVRSKNIKSDLASLDTTTTTGSISATNTRSACICIQ